MTSGSSKGCTKVSFVSFSIRYWPRGRPRRNCRPTRRDLRRRGPLTAWTFTVGVVIGITIMAWAPRRSGGQCDALRVVARRGANHPALQRLRRQLRHLVVGAPQLEREDALHVLALQQHGIVEPGRKVRRLFQRRFLRHVIDASSEDLLEIVGHVGLCWDTPSGGGRCGILSCALSTPIFSLTPTRENRISRRSLSSRQSPDCFHPATATQRLRVTMAVSRDQERSYAEARRDAGPAFIRVRMVSARSRGSTIIGLVRQTATPP